MSELLPLQIQATDIQQLHEQIINLRSEFATATSKVQTGSFSVRKVMGDISTRLQDAIRETITKIEATLVPKDQFADFEIGVRTLNEFADFDSLQYYNGLNQLKTYLRGIDAAMIEVQDASVRSYGPQITSEDGVIDILTEEEFIDQGFLTPVVEQQPAHSFYVVKQGDSLRSIALSELDDPVRWPEIAAANDISDSDLLDGLWVGRTIKVPLDVSISNSQAEDNLVYETYYATNQEELNRFFFGRDIALKDGRFVLTSSGKLAVTEGMENVQNALQERFRERRGELNPMHPFYGLFPMEDPGRMPLVIFLDKLLSDMESQATADPRVIAAFVDRARLKREGDVLRVAIRIELLSGNKTDMVIVNPQNTVL